MNNKIELFQSLEKELWGSEEETYADGWMIKARDNELDEKQGNKIIDIIDDLKYTRLAHSEIWDLVANVCEFSNKLGEFLGNEKHSEKSLALYVRLIEKIYS